MLYFTCGYSWAWGRGAESPQEPRADAAGGSSAEAAARGRRGGPTPGPRAVCRAYCIVPYYTMTRKCGGLPQGRGHVVLDHINHIGGGGRAGSELALKPPSGSVRIHITHCTIASHYIVSITSCLCITPRSARRSSATPCWPITCVFGYFRCLCAYLDIFAACA